MNSSIPNITMQIPQPQLAVQSHPTDTDDRGHKNYIFSSGDNDIYDIHFAPLNIFENKVVLVELDNLS